MVVNTTNEDFAFEEMVGVFEEAGVYSIVDSVKILLEHYPSLKEQLAKATVYRVSVALTTKYGGIDMLDILSINQSFEKFTKMSKREIIDLKQNAHVINPNGIINQFYDDEAYILKVQGIGELQALLQNHSEADLEKFGVYFGTAPIIKTVSSSELFNELLEGQKDVYYNKNGYIDFYPSLSKDVSILHNLNIFGSQNTDKTSHTEGYLEDFPSAALLAKESVKVFLQNIFHSIQEAVLKGDSFIKTTEAKEIEFIFLNIVALEEKGYEVSFDYDNHLDIDDDQLTVEDMHVAYISWEHCLQNKYS